MKAKNEMVLVILCCSIPAFGAGWFWSASPAPPTTIEIPVNQVVRAIESEEREPRPETALPTAAIFDSLHNRTVTSFVKTLESFGFSRIGRVNDMRHTDLWTLHPGRNDGFQVSLIGLDRESPVRFEPEAGATVSPTGFPQAFEIQLATLASSKMATAGNPQPLDEMDLAGVAKFRESENLERLIFSGHDFVTGFGPIRASESCLQCHDGDAGELLGLFRYTFPLPDRPLRLELAVSP